MTDIDNRPGEVELPGRGSLHSTPEGFSLKVIEKSELSLFAMAASVSPRRERSYEVNNTNGTITVYNTVDDSSLHGGGPGHIERYTIDTNTQTVKDYTKDPRRSGLARVGLAIANATVLADFAPLDSALRHPIHGI